MSTSLTVAISPCPNDTCIFAAWLLGCLSTRKLPATRFLWEDVQQLNERASSLANIHTSQDESLLIKMSAATALAHTDTYTILPCGAAFGTSSGPKLVTHQNAPEPLRTIAVPGMDTTAFALLRAALPYPFTPVPMLFSDIVSAVQSQQVHAGLLIHETALVYNEYGLELRLDLGDWWKTHSAGLPLPLGVIGIAHNTPPGLLEDITDTLRASLTHAQRHPESIRPLVRALAQELDDTTLDAHIEAYVDKYTMDMGQQGQDALDTLRRFLGGCCT